MNSLMFDNDIKEELFLDDYYTNYETAEEEFNDEKEEIESYKPSNDNLLQNYINEIYSIPLLNREDEIKYAKMVIEGKKLEKKIENLKKELGHTPKIREMSKKLDLSLDKIKHIQADYELGNYKLITSNLRLVISIAKKYQNKGLPLLDLIQEGNIGLMRAVEKFDPNKGYRFSTYATWWVRQGVTRALSSKSHTIRLPLHIMEILNKMKKNFRKMYQEKGSKIEEIDNKSLANEVGISFEQFNQISSAALEPISLDTRITIDDDINLVDIIPAWDEPIEDMIIKKSLRENIEKVMDSLTIKEKEVINLRYGLEDGKQRSLQEIANKYNVTRERIRQIINSSLLKLREPNNINMLSDYLSSLK